MASSSANSSPLPSKAMVPIASSQYPLQNPRTHDVFQTIVNGRKSWKTLRGGEVVWPPELEAALIEGLENYQPDDSRETRLLGRFPMRNRFISDWIYEKTGKRRTAKQVGSRLQQLRDTCGGKRLLTLISPIARRPCRPTSLSPKFHHRNGHLAYGTPSLRSESDSSSDSSSSSPSTPIEAHATLQNLLYRGIESRERDSEAPSTIVYIDLLRPDSSISVNSPSPGQTAEERSWIDRGYKIVRATQHPRYLRDIDPTITFLSHSITDARSYFTVHSGDTLIFSESTTLEPLDAISNVDGILYKTSLVPGLWDTIAQSSDASQYTIIQRVVQDSPSSSSPASTSSTIFSAIYKFLYQTPSPTEQNSFIPQILTTEALLQKNDFSLEDLLSIEADAYPDMMAFTKSPDFFNLGFTMTPDSWSRDCSPAPSVFSSPSHYPQTMPNFMLDEDEQLLSPMSSFDGSDMSNYL
ncbi:hypothetical protein BYT27DRAFT_7192967 [Phlegmacium glaucopus]|nr:hypothetical protein BYT27DRAFT_7192967 [Phlegmacium glaucopus]